MEDNTTRLRQRPAQRFEGESHLIDLKTALATLRAELHDAQNGHRQIALFHGTSVTLVLFAFEAGGALPEHSANAQVSIQILEGRFTIEVGVDSHELAAGSLLVLNPNVLHNVHCHEAGALLLTVHLEAKR